MEIHKFLKFLSQGAVQSKDGFQCLPINTSMLIGAKPTAPIYESSVDTYILDSELKPVKPGQIGALYIGKQGYSATEEFHPKLKPERFVDNPHDFGQIYKTGYWARAIDETTIGYYPQHGGVRFQGYRIPVTEMMATISQFCDMDECLVVPQISENNFALIAYISSRCTIDLNELTQFAEDRLPKCWVPTDYFVLDGLPKTNGGIDYAGLPLPKRLLEVSCSAKTELEVTLSQLFLRFLTVENIDINVGFFDMGGDSLSAIALLSVLHEKFDVSLTVSQLYQYASIQQLSVKIKEIQQSHVSPILPMAQHGLKLAERQMHCWIQGQVSNGQGMVCSQVMRLFGSVNIPALEFSLSAVFARHRTLQLRIDNHAGVPVPSLLEKPSNTVFQWDAEAVFSQVDHTSEMWEQQNEAISFLMYSEQNKAFNIAAQDTLLRVGYLQFDDDDHVLIISGHKIIIDELALNKISQELIETYASFVDDSAIMTLAPKVDFFDYAYWSYDYAVQSQETTHYWQKRLENVPNIQLMTDFPREELTYHCKRYFFEIDHEMTDAISNLAAQFETTRFVVMLAAFNILLYRYSQQQNFAVGVVDEGRNTIGTEEMVGAFESEYCVVLDFSPQISIETVIQQLKVELSAGQHKMPFSHDWYRLADKPAMHPYYQVGFNMHSSGGHAFYAAGLDVETLSVDYVNSPLDLALDLMDGSTLQGSFVYKSALFAESTIDRMIQHFSQIVLEMTMDTAQAVDQLPMMDANELQSIRQMLVETAYPRVIEDPSTCLLEGKFSQYAKKSALVSGQGAMSYLALYQQANHVAQYLRLGGLQAGDVVAVSVHQTDLQSIALLGIHLAGLTYLLVEDDWDVVQLQQITAVIDVALQLDDQHVTSILSREGDLDSQWAGKQDDDNACVLCEFDPLGQVIIATLTYGQASHQVSWLQRNFELRAFDQALFDVPLTASEYCWALMWPLSVGATLIRDSHELLNGMQACLQNPTFVLLDDAVSLNETAKMMCVDHVRTVLSRHQVQEDTSRMVSERFSGAKHYSLFSVLECGGPVGCYQYGKSYRLEQMQIGCPGDNMRYHIYDGKLRTMPIGLPGTFMVSGVQVANVLTPGHRLVEKNIRGETLKYVNLGFKARLLSNGEVECVELPAEIKTNVLQQPISSEVTDKVVAIVQSLLPSIPVLLSHDFFKLGGNSLMVSQLCYRLSECFKVEVTLNAILKGCTIRELIISVEQCLLEQSQSLCHDQTTYLEKSLAS
ncbi:MAG: AMP-binding protein [Methylococcales bacterium]|jgi:acyl carrier protein|nr:AMP-binding protein [Methylococcales bacterium]